MFTLKLVNSYKKLSWCRGALTHTGEKFKPIRSVELTGKFEFNVFFPCDISTRLGTIWSFQEYESDSRAQIISFPEPSLSLSLSEALGTSFAWNVMTLSLKNYSCDVLRLIVITLLRVFLK